MKNCTKTNQAWEVVQKVFERQGNGEISCFGEIHPEFR